MSIPVFVINTPGEPDLFANVASQFNDYDRFAVFRVEGVLGRTLPGIVCRYCTHDPNSINNKGAVGVFFAHVNAWEALIASNANQGLVLEDDVTVDNLDMLKVDQCPADFDVIFVNDRTAPIRSDNADQLQFEHIGSSMPAIESRQMSVGGDGYILSSNGAKKLIEAVKTDRFFSHVDLRILAYCLTDSDIECHGDSGPVGRELRDLFRFLKRGTYLKGFSAYPTIVTHKRDKSRRVREDQLGREEPRSGDSEWI